ncbi:protein RALF-like 24 [Manihot esculenta]|uniref:Uncharacterized protein n=1 Tax=Manihot esculenta TaxID=3983 RepID=A0ACB7G9J2_MANES|nr:protein RALF-like 24 [Manihot esculenta]KAG8636910.1 hypothetical protein MANES_15G057100v8 [Manihot esculenta]
MTFPTTKYLTPQEPPELNHSSRTKNMSRPTFYILALLFLHTHLAICNGVSVSGLENTEIDAMVRRGCTNKSGGCFEDAEMESEISRRVLLLQKKYISYETLKRDMVPCAKPGASYYDCHAGEANPYSRGCEVITRPKTELMSWTCKKLQSFSLLDIISIF